jgi:translation initiation factor 3 subunit J
MQLTFWALPRLPTVSISFQPSCPSSPFSIQNTHASLFSSFSTTDAISKLKTANPSSKEDWEQFSDLLFTELIKKHSTKPGFEKHFAPHLFRNIASTMRDVDIRKSSTMLKAYAEEKVKAEKEAKKTGGQKVPVGKAKPKTVGTASAKNVIDTNAYGDEALDDDLDFM